MKYNKMSKKKKNINIDVENHLLNKDTAFNVKESYNQLRTNVAFSFAKSECKKIMVTSSLASEGKSTTCMNLAISFADIGHKVLVVDVDLRRPNINKLLRLDNKKGISNILVGECKTEEALQNSSYRNLDVISAGTIPPNPTELLTSDRLNKLVDELSLKYDYIFFDTPPVSVVTDGLLLNDVVDGAIIVCRQYVADKSMIVDSVNKMKFVGIKVIGSVLNDIVYTKSSYKYDKDYYYGEYPGEG